MRAVYRFCKFLDRGLECRRAPMNGERACGCRPEQLDYEFRRGISRSHRRKIAKQLRLGRYDYRNRPPVAGCEYDDAPEYHYYDAAEVAAMDRVMREV